MAGMNGVGGPVGGMPLMNNMANGANGAMPRPGGELEDPEYEGRLNAYIYDYFVRKEHFDCARALVKSGMHMAPALRSRDNDVNGADDNAMQTDSKDDVDSKRPDDLPPPSVNPNAQDPSFLLEWFALFWDVYIAQRRKPNASAQAMQYVQHAQHQSRLRTEQQAHLLRGSMPGVMPDQYQMMRQNGMVMNGDMRARAMQNRGIVQPNPQQLAQMKNAQLISQQAMRRDPSDMDVNSQRARTPSSGDNAPSPSKRQRIENMPFNGQQMMPNGRGPMSGMQGQQMMDTAMNANQASQMLRNNGINPETLSQTQFQTFQAQNPAIQAKSIQVYAQNSAQNSMRNNGNRQGMPTPGMPGQGSPIMQQNFDLSGGVQAQFINNEALMRGAGQPGTANGGNHALHDYQMQLMLLEQQNKKRLLMARQEQDGMGQPDRQPMPGGPGYVPGMSPAGSRSGPSPGPNDQMGKRGSPKMGQTVLPGSPMPDGSMPQQRGSPAAMSFNGQAPEMYPMNVMIPNGIRMTPGSHPGQMGAGAFQPQQHPHMEAIRAPGAAGRIPNGQQWQHGPPQGQAPMMQPNQTQQPAQVGTPNQRNAMPPPQGVPAGTANGARPSSPAQGAPPTPQTTNKANPKAKKDTKETRKRPTKKNTNNAAATPASEAEAPPTPTPATPITPQHPNSFQKNDAPSQAAMPPAPNPVAPAPGLVAPPPDINAVPPYDMGTAENFPMGFADLAGTDVLENFDFDSFLHDDSGFDLDSTGFPFGNGDGVEAGTEGT